MAEYGFLIPVYNHGLPCRNVVRKLLPYGLPVILVDDGSDGETKKQLAEIRAWSPLVALHTRPTNGGKGAAVADGFAVAHAMGLAYVLQVDADGQHDLSRVPEFLAVSRRNPGSLVCGYPRYDASVPASRRKGREVSNWFVHLVTLNRHAVRDALCGFRVYPVEAAYAVTRGRVRDRRMGFDIEILVKLYWAGVPIVNEEVGVSYPPGGTSHFHMVRDNLCISLMFTRLCFGAFLRLPKLLALRRRHG